MGTPRTPEQKAKAAERQRAWRAANPEKLKAQRHRWEQAHPEKRAEINRKSRDRFGPDYWRGRQQALKLAAITVYGGLCACCGETEIEFLSIDHVGGGGTQERKRVGASGVYRMLRDSGWPVEKYRVLCMNCQFGTRFGRTCPHQADAVG